LCSNAADCPSGAARPRSFNDLPVIDFSVAPENFTLANSMGWMFDNLHETKFGYAIEASLVADAMMALAA
jgi:hypothetical protein